MTVSSSWSIQVPFASNGVFTPAIQTAISPMVGATLRTSIDEITSVSSPSSSVAIARTGIVPSSSGVNVQVGCVNPSRQFKSGQETLTCWPDGETVSMSPLSLASMVMEDSTAISVGWLRLMYGARLRIVTLLTNTVVSSSLSVTTVRNSQSPSSDQFQLMAQSGVVITSTRPGRDSISNRHSTSPPSGSKEERASMKTSSNV